MDPSPSINVCKFFVARKKRYCRGMTKGPNELCPEHSINNESENGMKRVVCPVDNKHSVYEHKLIQHLKVCNANIPKSKIFYSEKINAGSDSEGEDDFESVKLNDINIEEIKSLIMLILAIRKSHLAQDDRIYDININTGAINDQKTLYQIKSDKHTFQYVNLIENMKQMDMLNLSQEDANVFLEFGAGRGGFSHFIEKTMSSLNSKPLDDLTFVLIDKQGVRNRYDAKHKEGPKFERILMDISDLNLNKVEIVRNKKIFVISKHLCGTATDLTLRCLKNWVDKECLSKENIKNRFKGCVIALCCHHKCNWKSYINKPWIRKLGISPRQFHLMTMMSGWATCGDAKKVDTRFDDLLKSSGIAEKKEIGLLCKRILDLGRKYFIENEFGMNHVLLQPYIEQSVTLENCALFVY